MSSSSRISITLPLKSYEWLMPPKQSPWRRELLGLIAPTVKFNILAHSVLIDRLRECTVKKGNPTLNWLSRDGLLPIDYALDRLPAASDSEFLKALLTTSGIHAMADLDGLLAPTSWPSPLEVEQAVSSLVDRLASTMPLVFWLTYYSEAPSPLEWISELQKTIHDSGLNASTLLRLMMPSAQTASDALSALRTDLPTAHTESPSQWVWWTALQSKEPKFVAAFLSRYGCLFPHSTSPATIRLGRTLDSLEERPVPVTLYAANSGTFERIIQQPARCTVKEEADRASRIGLGGKGASGFSIYDIGELAGEAAALLGTQSSFKPIAPGRESPETEESSSVSSEGEEDDRSSSGLAEGDSLMLRALDVADTPLLEWRARDVAASWPVSGLNSG